MFSFFVSVRILCAGVIHPPVKMEALAGSRELLTPANVRLDGPVFTVISPACLARSQPNNKVRHPGQKLGYVFLLQLKVVHCVTSPSWISGVEVAHLCRNSGQCLDAGNTHYCRCQAGYTGSYCQEQVDECSPNPCQNGAVCTDYLGGYSCEVGLFFKLE